MATSVALVEATVVLLAEMVVAAEEDLVALAVLVVNMEIDTKVIPLNKVMELLLDTTHTMEAVATTEVLPVVVPLEAMIPTTTLTTPKDTNLKATPEVTTAVHIVKAVPVQKEVPPIVEAWEVQVATSVDVEPRDLEATSMALLPNAEVAKTFLLTLFPIPSKLFIFITPWA